MDILGFFYTEQQSILTHYDTYIRLHLITKDRKLMEHLDNVKLNPESIKLYLPKKN